MNAPDDAPPTHTHRAARWKQAGGRSRDGQSGLAPRRPPPSGPGASIGAGLLQERLCLTLAKTTARPARPGTDHMSVRTLRRRGQDAEETWSGL